MDGYRVNLQTSGEVYMNPGNMNSKFIKIWDNEIGKHLAAGDINIE